MCPVFREQLYQGGKVVYLILLKWAVRLGEVKGTAPIAVASLERQELGVQPGSRILEPALSLLSCALGEYLSATPTSPQKPVDSGNEGPLAWDLSLGLWGVVVKVTGSRGRRSGLSQTMSLRVPPPHLQSLRERSDPSHRAVWVTLCPCAARYAHSWIGGSGEQGGGNPPKKRRAGTGGEPAAETCERG